MKKPQGYFDLKILDKNNNIIYKHKGNNDITINSSTIMSLALSGQAFINYLLLGTGNDFINPGARTKLVNEVKRIPIDIRTAIITNNKLKLSISTDYVNIVNISEFGLACIVDENNTILFNYKNLDNPLTKNGRIYLNWIISF